MPILRTLVNKGLQLLDRAAKKAARSGEIFDPSKVVLPSATAEEQAASKSALRAYADYLDAMKYLLSKERQKLLHQLDTEMYGKFGVGYRPSEVIPYEEHMFGEEIAPLFISESDLKQFSKYEDFSYPRAYYNEDAANPDAYFDDMFKSTLNSYRMGEWHKPSYSQRYLRDKLDLLRRELEEYKSRPEILKLIDKARKQQKMALIAYNATKNPRYLRSASKYYHNNPELEAFISQREKELDILEKMLLEISYKQSLEGNFAGSKLEKVLKPGEEETSWEAYTYANELIDIGRKLGIKPFDVYPGDLAMPEIIKRALAINNPYMLNINLNPENYSNIWKLLTGAFLGATSIPMLLRERTNYVEY